MGIGQSLWLLLSRSRSKDVVLLPFVHLYSTLLPQVLVYIPAGVGGAPGGVAYGLKRIFKDSVHCFFCEPLLCPSLLLGIATQKFEKCSVHDYGISGITHADGLACASPSGFVTRIMTNLLSGEFTVTDAKLYDYLRLLYQAEDIQIEPSSCAAFAGPVGLLQYADSAEYCSAHGLDGARLASAVQIAWAAGGRLAPEENRVEYLNTHLLRRETPPPEPGAAHGLSRRGHKQRGGSVCPHHL